MESQGYEAGSPASSSKSGVNDARTGADRGTGLTQTRSRPVQFELVSYRGEIFGPYDSIEALRAAAKAKWPDQDQDEDRTGRGWDCQVARTTD